MSIITDLAAKLAGRKGHGVTLVLHGLIAGGVAGLVQGWRYEAQLSTIQADWANERAVQSRLCADEQDKARIEEQWRFIAIVKPPAIPALPAQARQSPTPSACLPSCLENLMAWRKSTQARLTEPGPAD